MGKGREDGQREGGGRKDISFYLVFNSFCPLIYFSAEVHPFVLLSCREMAHESGTINKEHITTFKFLFYIQYGLEAPQMSRETVETW